MWWEVHCRSRCAWSRPDRAPAGNKLDQQRKDHGLQCHIQSSKGDPHRAAVSCVTLKAPLVLRLMRRALQQPAQRWAAESRSTLRVMHPRMRVPLPCSEPRHSAQWLSL